MKMTPRQFIAKVMEDYPNPNNKDGDLEIGDDVEVVANGQDYKGKVASKDPVTGKIKPSFAGPRPPQQDFKPNEIRRLRKPGDPQRSSASYPASPPSTSPYSGPFTGA